MWTISQVVANVGNSSNVNMSNLIKNKQILPVVRKKGSSGVNIILLWVIVKFYRRFHKKQSGLLKLCKKNVKIKAVKKVNFENLQNYLLN